MSDLISRQAAVEDIRTMIPEDARLDIKWIEMWLKQLPSVQPDITEKQIAEYCRKRNLVLITYESFETLKAYYDRQNSV